MRVKRSTLAGSWYPEQGATLRRLVERFLAEAPVPPAGRAVAAVVPHAGYRYSGSVAAAAYRCFEHQPWRRAVLLAPSHRSAYRGIAVLDAEGFATPLGVVPIDALEGSVLGHPLVRVDPRPFEGEHSLEIQLPLLQCVLPDVSVVPLLCGWLAEDDFAAAAALLERLCDGTTIFLVSSDFTHFGPRFGYEPFRPQSAEQARALLRQLDMGAIEPALRGDRAAFHDSVERSGATICGRVPIEVFLAWAGSRLEARLLAYRTSLDATGDYEDTVSYAAIAYLEPR
jgi:hypothetical protein